MQILLSADPWDCRSLWTHIEASLADKSNSIEKKSEPHIGKPLFGEWVHSNHFGVWMMELHGTTSDTLTSFFGQRSPKCMSALTHAYASLNKIWICNLKSQSIKIKLPTSQIICKYLMTTYYVLSTLIHFSKFEVLR